MTRTKLYFILFTTICFAHAQAIGQNILWQKSIGGSAHDFIEDAIHTKDNGILITCSSNSGISGNKTEMCFGEYDYWIIKINPSGDILWQKTLGGDKEDEPIAVLQTRDSGYLICGESSSGISGNKTTQGYGNKDFWVVKLDQNGNTIWQQSYGRSWVDHLVTAFPDPSGGYILAGYSWVGTDDVDYDTLKGRYDCWLIQIDEEGKVLWEETFGSKEDDILTDAIIDHRGTIVLSGYTKYKVKDQQGKTQNEYKESGVILISPDRKNILQKSLTDYGSFSCEKLAVDPQNNYYLGGDVFPGITKEDPSDFLIVVLNDKGDVIRDFTIGGNGADFINHLAVTSEKELYIGGSSGSGISKDKSEPAYGLMNGWICKYSSSGKKLWDKTIGGTGLESLAKILISPDRSITVFLQSTSGKSGNLTAETNGETEIVMVRLEEQ